MAENTIKTPTSDAYKNLEANLGKLVELTALLYPTKLEQVVKKGAKHIERQLAMGPAIKVSYLKRTVSEISTAVDKYVKARTLTFEWTSVMLVAFIETYLEESLTLIAKKDPALMKNMDPMPPDKILNTDSIEELKDDLRQQWANKTLKGGPKQWLKRLQAMGSPPYTKDCSFRMEHLWDTRNLVVHARGIADRHYAITYKTPQIKAGNRIVISGAILTWWLQGIAQFVDPIDVFFLKYGNRKLHSAEQKSE